MLRWILLIAALLLQIEAKKLGMDEGGLHHV